MAAKLSHGSKVFAFVYKSIATRCDFWADLMYLNEAYNGKGRTATGSSFPISNHSFIFASL